MKLREEGNLDHLKNHRCRTCGSVFDLAAEDLYLAHQLGDIRNEMVAEYFMWSCERCAHRNKLVVTTHDDGTVTTEDFY